MYPHERSLVKKLKDEPFAIVGVNSDRDPKKLAEVLVAKQITWPSFFDGGGTGGPIASRWGVRGWPPLFLLDGKGVIRFVGLRGEPLEKAILKLLAEMKE